MLKIGIILGSTRPGRNGAAVANWVLEQASKRTDATFELVDIESFHLPLLDKPHTIAWAEKIASLDAFVVVTPEYNHSTSGALKNAIDYLYSEWANKAAGFVGYGSLGGARAVEHLRVIFAELQVATVRGQVALSLFTDFEQYHIFKPSPMHDSFLTTMLDQLVAWGGALKPLRAK
jgi:NAD(P)H-dependent FMN reductase